MAREARSSLPSDLWTFVKNVRDVALALVLGAIVTLMGVGFIHKSSEDHPLFGVLVAAMYTAVVYQGLLELRSKPARYKPLHYGLIVVFLTVTTAIAIAAAASRLLAEHMGATYAPLPEKEYMFLHFFHYYTWVFFDMLPGLKMTELLAFEPLLKPKDAMAGAPVVAFRAFIVFGLLAALKTWWHGRTRQDEEKSAPTLALSA